MKLKLLYPLSIDRRHVVFVLSAHLFVCFSVCCQYLLYLLNSPGLLKTVILQESVILQNSVTFTITENCNIKSKITEYCNIRKQGVKESHTGYYCFTACIL